MSTALAGVGTAFIAGVRQQLLGLRDEANAVAAAAMDESLTKGEDVAHQKIEMSTTPTGDRRARDNGGHPGRIVTGDFRDDFQHDSYQLDENRMQGRFGWIGDDGTPIYYEVQENGSQVVPVAGVHALLDASEVAKSEFKSQLKAWVGSKG
ncbi:hypothetical protein [Leifsonia aquatica]|uniref:hypothetical protein n=1 Tax=Leifsonia aquatica TaxID=144185 RepID=UPI000469307D|nr:hypothetical protein [Leifsonia aquatica]